MIQNLRKLITKFKIRINPEPEYPCKECFLILGGTICRELCDKVEMDNDKIQKHVEEHRCCIDCGAQKFYRGPSGGMSVNIQCALCGHKFNNGLPMIFERIGI